MNASPTTYTRMTDMVHRRSSSSVARLPSANVAPCVLDLLGHVRPQAHVAKEALI